MYPRYLLETDLYAYFKRKNELFLFLLSLLLAGLFCVWEIQAVRFKTVFFSGAHGNGLLFLCSGSPVSRHINILPAKFGRRFYAALKRSYFYDYCT